MSIIVNDIEVNEKNSCFLCHQEVHGKVKGDAEFSFSSAIYNIHRESSALLFQILDISLHRIYVHQHIWDKIKYCGTCYNRISNVWKLLQDLENLKMVISQQTFMINSQLNSNTRNHLPISSAQQKFRDVIRNELELKSIQSNLGKVLRRGTSNLKLKKVKIMESVTIPKTIMSVNPHKIIEEVPMSESETVVKVFMKPDEVEELVSLNDDAVGDDFEILEIKNEDEKFSVLDFLNPLSIEGEAFNSESVDCSLNEEEDPFRELICPTVESVLRTNQIHQTATNFVKSSISSFTTIYTPSTAYSKPHVEQRFICGACGAIFEDYIQLKDHSLTHESINTYFEGVVDRKRFKCQYCHKTYTRKDNLKMHEKSHTGECAFKCQYCDKAFMRRYHAKRHEETHTNSKQRPFKCQYCDKAFMRRYLAKSHELTHTGEKPFKCKYCDKAFRRKGTNFKDHERNHLGEKRYKCRFCEARFAYYGRLKTHEWTHTGEKLFKCKYCDKTFRRNGTNLKDHERKHLGAKYYKCRFCEARFTYGSGLRTHERKHTNEGGNK